MILAEAGTEDREAIVQLWRDCGLTRPWNDPHRDFALAVGGSASTILTLKEGETVAASILVGFDGHRGWVYYLAVAPGRRREGLGRQLMEAAEAWLRSRGAPKIQLMVREDNEAAIGFYKALGLEPQKVVTLGRFLDPA